MEWIISDGGPLICMEETRVPSWGGIDSLSVQVSGAANDYDRACQPKAYTAAIPLVQGSALVITMGAFETSIWKLPSGAACIVSVEAADPGIDEQQKLALIDEAIFDHPLETTEILFATGRLTIFDSAAPGAEPDEPSLSFEVIPGRYKVLSQAFEPDGSAMFTVYKFLRLSEAVEVPGA